MIRKPRVPLLLATVALVATLGLGGCASNAPPDGVTPVTAFDVNRYQGRWYELARLDHAFERGMTNVSATYRVQADGSVKVVNQGYDPSQQRWREAVGKAYFLGAPTTASLKVSFFGPFYGGYHVAALGSHYEWALVIGDSVRYGWILARDRQMEPQQLRQIVLQAQALGIAPSAWHWVAHDLNHRDDGAPPPREP